MRPRRRSLSLIGLSLLALGLGGCGEAESPASDASGRVAFTVNDNGWNEIWVLDVESDERRRLTKPVPSGSDAAGNTMPRWSPNGDRIAYVGTGTAVEEDPNDQELYVMGADGGSVQRLTSNRVADWSPSWSPDGRRIVFSRERGRGTRKAEAALYMMAADGSGERLLRREPGGIKGGLLFTPAWSPSGEQIAYSRLTYGEQATSDIYVMASNGKRARKVIDDASQPAWSPDGARIAYSSFSDFFGETCFEECRPSSEIYVADADGSNPVRVTHDPADDTSPVWSPDGESVMFVSDRSDRDGHEYELYIASAEGDDPERITRTPVWEFEPDWSAGPK